MKKWVRWKGLIGFAVTVVLLMLFFILFIDSIIKSSIEYTGTRMAGAKVELDNAEFHFSPLGMQINRLQITNPDLPMQNIIDIKNIHFNLDGLNLLRRKVLINEMQVDGIRLNTARKISGAIKQENKSRAPAKITKSDEGKDFKLPNINIPNADQILAREEIKTAKLATLYKSNIKASQDNWNKIKQDIPGEKKINDYQQRIDKIKQADTKDIQQLSATIKELKSIKKEIKADIIFVETSKNKINGDINKLDRDLKVLKNSPQEEFSRLSDKYSANTSNIGNVSHLLFGHEAKKYTELAMGWYKKIEPWLAYVDFSGSNTPTVDRRKGIDVKFREDKPTPDFFIKLIRATVEIEQGNFSGEIKNITNEQNITHKPITLHFTGAKMQGLDSILLTGTFNHINPGKAIDQLNYSMINYELNKYRLINNDDMTIYLDKAKSDITLVAQRKNNKIHADFKSHIHSIKYNNQASGNELSMMFLSSLNKTRNFNIYGDLRGTFDHYTTKVSSDLDNRLKDNMKHHMNQKMVAFRKTLKDKISLQARQPIQDAEGKFNNLNSGIKNDIAIRKARFNQQLNTTQADIEQKEQQIKAKSDVKKQQLKNKAKDKLKNLFK